MGASFETKVLTFHLNWKLGIMPEPGGLLDQGACYPQAMASVEAGYNAAQSLKQEQAKREQEKRQRKGSGKTRRRGR